MRLRRGKHRRLENDRETRKKEEEKKQDRVEVLDILNNKIIFIFHFR
jgi:hypothetical protein